MRVGSAVLIQPILLTHLCNFQLQKFIANLLLLGYGLFIHPQKSINKVQLKKIRYQQVEPRQIQQTPCNAAVDQEVSHYVFCLQKSVSNLYLTLIKNTNQPQKDIKNIQLEKISHEQIKPIQIQQTPCNAALDQEVSNYVSRLHKFISNSHLIKIKYSKQL